MTERVVFPDATDIPGLPADPFAITAKTDEGDVVRPAVVIALLNRATKRKLERKWKADAQSKGIAEPIIAPAKRLSEQETTARVADMLLTEWDRYHVAFPAHTLAQFLDDRTADTMLEAFRKGKPIDRDATRRAIGTLWKEAEAERQRKGQTNG